jgi:hypothetical protein
MAASRAWCPGQSHPVKLPASRLCNPSFQRTILSKRGPTCIAQQPNTL